MGVALLPPPPIKPKPVAIPSSSSKKGGKGGKPKTLPALGDGPAAAAEASSSQLAPAVPGGSGPPAAAPGAPADGAAPLPTVAPKNRPGTAMMAQMRAQGRTGRHQ